MPDRVAAVILAAGAGTRMRSSRPKPLHLLCGRPMIEYSIDAVEAVDPQQVVVVLSPELNASDDVLSLLQRRLGEKLGIAIQYTVLGTGDALASAMPLLDTSDRVLVLFADHPLLRAESIARLTDFELDRANPLCLLTSLVPDAAGYGRIDRTPDGRITRIVERKDDRPELRTGPCEVNSGMMAISGDWLRSSIGRLTRSFASGEFYLTELVEIAVTDGLTVRSVIGSPDEMAGVNDRVDLARAESAIQTRIHTDLQGQGVTLINPDTISIEHGVLIGSDTTILPGAILRSGTVIGAGCEIGPYSVLTNARIGDRCRITASYVSDSAILEDSDVGPFSHIRGGSEIGREVHIGSFGEIKNSSLATETRMGHFGYIGDATIGERTNIGAGVVTCNFDGIDKHRTIVGADVFLGSDSMLVAPLTIGDGAVTGAGSVVTRNVPAGSRVAGVPAKPLPDKSDRSEDKR